MVTGVRSFTNDIIRCKYCVACIPRLKILYFRPVSTYAFTAFKSLFPRGSSQDLSCFSALAEIIDGKLPGTKPSFSAEYQVGLESSPGKIGRALRAL